MALISAESILTLSSLQVVWGIASGGVVGFTLGLVGGGGSILAVPLMIYVVNSGFFGIGGGFLIVPGLIGSTSMPMLNAVGTSLLAVTAFGLTTSLNYALSGLVDWPLAGVFIGGGAVGSVVGTAVARRLAGTTGRLTSIFALLKFVVAAYILWRGRHP